MKSFLRIFFSAEGQGNIGYDNAPSDTTGQPLTAANDGLSTDLATGKKAQLGQTLGRAGDPAKLLEDREIPMNGHRLFMTNAAGDAIGFDAMQGISVSNRSGQSYQAFWQIGGNSGAWKIFTDNAIDVIQQFQGGLLTSLIVWNGNSVDPGKFVPDSPFIFGSGIGQFNTPVAGGGGSHVLAQGESFLLVDTTAGAVQIDIDVVANTLKRQRFIVKKISADLNNVTLNMLAGTIQAIGAAAATLVFNTQGEAIEFICDDLNAYVI